MLAFDYFKVQVYIIIQLQEMGASSAKEEPTSKVVQELEEEKVGNYHKSDWLFLMELDMKHFIKEHPNGDAKNPQFFVKKFVNDVLKRRLWSSDAGMKWISILHTEILRTSKSSSTPKEDGESILHFLEQGKALKIEAGEQYSQTEIWGKFEVQKRTQQNEALHPHHAQ